MQKDGFSARPARAIEGFEQGKNIMKGVRKIHMERQLSDDH